MKANYIQSLHATSIGMFKSLDVSFNNRFNFIIGPNGCGKTSILKCIAVNIAPYMASEFRCKDDSEMWMDCIIKDLPLRIGMTKGWVKKGEEYRKAQFYSPQSPPQVLNSDRQSFCSIEIGNDIPLNPLFLSAYRKIEYNKIIGMVSEAAIAEKRQQYRSNSVVNLNGSYLPPVKQWLINRYFILEKPWAKKYVQNWDWLIENLKNIGPKDSNFKFLEIKSDLEPSFEVFGKACYLEELSSGFQAVLSLILAIFEWIETTNEEDEIYVKDAAGTVIIDELDVHLHPEWQLTIRKSLETLFPNLQFIVTTHSPHIISSAKSGELLILHGNNDIVDLKPSRNCYFGWSSDQILEDLMGVDLGNKHL